MDLIDRDSRNMVASHRANLNTPFNTSIIFKWNFFYFKTKFLGFQFIDIDNQTPRID